MEVVDFCRPGQVIGSVQSIARNVLKVFYEEAHRFNTKIGTEEITKYLNSTLHKL